MRGGLLQAAGLLVGLLVGLLQAGGGLLQAGCLGSEDEPTPEQIEYYFTKASCERVKECSGIPFEDCVWDLGVLFDSYQRTSGWVPQGSWEKLGECLDFIERKACESSIWWAPECDFGQHEEW